MKRRPMSAPDIDEVDGPRSELPRSWQLLSEQHPELVAAYDVLSDVCRHAGPLDERTVALVKLAISVGHGIERTVHSHTKKAIRAGFPPAALRQVVLTALPTVGLPAALDALRWVQTSIDETRGGH